MCSSRKRELTPGNALIYVFLTVLAIIYIVPLVWVLFVSVKTNDEVIGSPWGIPEVIHLENYIGAWTSGGMGRAMLNSLLVCSATLLITIVTGSMVAFAIAIMRWKFANKLLGIYLMGMMVPVHCILIPLFIVFSKVHITNTYFSMIMPYIAFGLPTTIYLMTGFFKSIPWEVYEAAYIDGCSIYRIFFQIAMPLSKSGIFVISLMTFVGNWNELLVAMVFVNNPSYQTIPIRLTTFVSPYATDYVKMFAAIVLAMLPTIIIYCMFSNKIVAGLTQGAVKG